MGCRGGSHLRTAAAPRLDLGGRWLGGGGNAGPHGGLDTEDLLHGTRLRPPRLSPTGLRSCLSAARSSAGLVALRQPRSGPAAARSSTGRGAPRRARNPASRGRSQVHPATAIQHRRRAQLRQPRRTRLGSPNPRFQVDGLQNLTQLEVFNAAGFALQGAAASAVAASSSGRRGGRGRRRLHALRRKEGRRGERERMGGRL